jgi:hypothetical protein
VKLSNPGCKYAQESVISFCAIHLGNTGKYEKPKFDCFPLTSMGSKLVVTTVYYLSYFFGIAVGLTICVSAKASLLISLKSAASY